MFFCDPGAIVQKRYRPELVSEPTIQRSLAYVVTLSIESYRRLTPAFTAKKPTAACPMSSRKPRNSPGMHTPA